MVRAEQGGGNHASTVDACNSEVRRIEGELADVHLAHLWQLSSKKVCDRVKGVTHCPAAVIGDQLKVGGRRTRVA